MPQSPTNRSVLIAFLLIVIATLLVYSPVRNSDFVDFDDGEYVAKNEWVQKGLTGEGVRKAFTEPVSALIYPVTMLSHMLDCELFGLNPSAHHWVSVLFHALNAGLLLLVLYRLTSNLGLSFLAAAIFAVHPLNVESVAWVSQRKSVLCAFFGLFAILAYLRYLRRPSFARYIPIMMLFALSLMSKSMFVTLPCTLLLLDYWPLGRLRLIEEDGRVRWGLSIFSSDNRHLLTEKIPLFFLSAVSSVVTLLTQGGSGALVGLEAISPITRFALICTNYLYYLVKFFVPVRLAGLYSASGSLIPAWQTALGFVLLLAVMDWVIRNAVKRPYIAVGWFWYLGVLLPVSGILKTGLVARADRFAYLPMMGLLLAVVWGMAEVLKGRSKRLRIVQTALTGAVIVLFAFGARAQVRTWSSSQALYEHALRTTRHNELVHANMGGLLHKQGRYEEALTHFQEAVRIKPDYPEAQLNSGSTLTVLGRHAEALPYYKEAVRLRPDDAVMRYNLGLSQGQNGLDEEAEASLRKALELAESQGLGDLAREIRGLNRRKPR